MTTTTKITKPNRLFSRYLLTQYMLCYAKSLQSCPTLCNPIDGSPPGSPVPGILQARTLEWGAIAFSNSIYALCYSMYLALIVTNHIYVYITVAYNILQIGF